MIQTLEREEIARLNRTIPAFAPVISTVFPVSVLIVIPSRLLWVQPG